MTFELFSLQNSEGNLKEEREEGRNILKGGVHGPLGNGKDSAG